MKRYIIAVLALSGICTGASAQQAQVTRYTAPLAGKTVLKDVDDKYNAQVYNLELPAPGGDKKRLMEIKEQVHKLYPYKKSVSQLKTTAIPGPAVIASFVADSFPGIPPDNDMAISKGFKAVSVMNSNIAVLDGNQGIITQRKSLRPFSSSAGLNGINDYRYDPKIVYDPQADKYIIVMLNATNANNYIVIGFSQSNDPSGAWNFYKFYGNYKSDTTWFDYPCINITKNEFFLTGNKIKFNTSWQSGFTETVIYQIDKQSGYNGDANIVYQIWDGIQFDNKPIRNLFPVKADDALAGPEQYFVSNRNFDVQNDTVFLVRLPDVISSGNKNLTVTALKSPVPYGVPGDGRQVDTFTLATNDGRILGAYASNGEIQFVSTSINTANGASGIYHGRISNYASSPAITHAQIISVDTLDFGYPNITYAGRPWGIPQSMISFNYTGPNTHAGMAALLFDGAQYSPITRVKEGQGSIHVLQGKQQRWGDYTGSQIEWGNTGTVWIEGIYGRADNAYGCWMARLGSSLLHVNDNKPEEKAVSVFPNPAFEYTELRFEMPEKDNVKFYICHVSGRRVGQLLEAPCKAGSNLIRFNIAALPSGQYYVIGEGAKGTSVKTAPFVKQ